MNKWSIYIVFNIYLSNKILQIRECNNFLSLVKWEAMWKNLHQKVIYKGSLNLQIHWISTIRIPKIAFFQDKY